MSCDVSSLHALVETVNAVGDALFSWHLFTALYVECCRNADEGTPLADRLAGLFPIACNGITNPTVIGSVAVRHQLQAAINVEVWQTAFMHMTHLDPSNAFQRNMAPCPSSPEDVLDKVHDACTGCLEAYVSLGSPQHALEALCVRHACCTALIQLSLSISLQADASLMQHPRTGTWSETMHLAQGSGVCCKPLTFWPHVTASQAPIHAAFSSHIPTANSSFNAMQAFLDQASAVVMHQTSNGSNHIDQAMSYACLDLALLQAFSHVEEAHAVSTQQEQSARADSGATTRQLSSVMPVLAMLVQHLVEMTNQYLSVALEQHVTALSQQNQLEEVKTLMQLGLDTKQVRSVG